MTYRLRTAFGFAGLLVIDLVTMVVTAATSSTREQEATTAFEYAAETWIARGLN